MDYVVEEGLPAGVPPTITEELILTIKELASQRVSLHKIAKITNLDRSRVRAILGGKYTRGASGVRQREKWQEVRKHEYLRGLNSVCDPIDALCVGLYLGEGAWCDDSFNFVNSNIEYVSLMRKWAVRAGQEPTAFKGRIQVNISVDISDQDIKGYWAKAGIPLENIVVYRITSKSSKGKVAHKIPYGTCSLLPIKHGLHLFEYLKGQRDKLLKTGV